MTEESLRARIAALEAEVSELRAAQVPVVDPDGFGIDGNELVREVEFCDECGNSEIVPAVHGPQPQPNGTIRMSPALASMYEAVSHSMYYSNGVAGGHIHGLQPRGDDDE